MRIKSLSLIIAVILAMGAVFFTGCDTSQPPIEAAIIPEVLSARFAGYNIIRPDSAAESEIIEEWEVFYLPALFFIHRFPLIFIRFDTKTDSRSVLLYGFI